jgi:hypothetical protein
MGYTRNIAVNIRLSLQRALIQNISIHVRGICCDWDENMEWFKIYFYLDIPPNEEEKELQSCVMTEFVCDFQEFKKYYEECIYSEEPYDELEKLKLIIYWRNEWPVFGNEVNSRPNA